MIRKKKKYVKPRKAYEKARILEENKLMEKFGLKNKREIWKTLARINYFRSRAKALAKSSLEQQEILFGKLNNIGLDVKSTADVLALRIENLLERRLSTIVYKKGFASTPRQARQMIVHKKVLIGKNAVNAPGYIVSVHEENLISVNSKKQINSQFKVQEIKLESTGGKNV